MLKYKLIIINLQYNLFHIRSHEMQIDRNFYTKYWTSFEEKQGKKKSLRKAAESAAMKRQGRKLESIEIYEYAKSFRFVTKSRYHKKPWTIIVLKAKCKNVFSKYINKYAEKRRLGTIEIKTFQNNQIRNYRKQIERLFKDCEEKLLFCYEYWSRVFIIRIFACVSSTSSLRGCF